MLGDHVEVGCGSVLNPGTVIGRNTNIYLSPVESCIPADSIYKNAAEIIKRIKAGKTVFKEKEIPDDHKDCDMYGIE